MKIAIAILTYNRPEALIPLLASIKKCSVNRIGIFDDAGIQSGIDKIFKLETGQESQELQATYYRDKAFDIYVGTRNLGIAKNTNRALRWFEKCTDCDYLLLCNDDIEFTGNASKEYYEASQKYGIGLFCFNSSGEGTDLTESLEIFTPALEHGADPIGVPKFVKLTRLYGAVLAMPRSTIEQVGYFDARFGKYGEEHVEFTMRCYSHGLSKGLSAVDIYDSKVKMQQVVPSLPSGLVNAENVKAKNMLAEIAAECQTYVPFSLQSNSKVCGNEFDGISTGQLIGYNRVNSWENFDL